MPLCLSDDDDDDNSSDDDDDDAIAAAASGVSLLVAVAAAAMSSDAFRGSCNNAADAEAPLKSIVTLFTGPLPVPPTDGNTTPRRLVIVSSDNCKP